ncbi:MarR family winged helix-turn-helix transcriptional regulator [Acutalibacter caecimuris]|uniref:MarR family winged helix-turn-helix transcriptional regulator n=1 Tax=Acutalibacter caecimuris TaxID=3093657 RepID=UPI002AC8A4A2|nr:MarR family transcriptional regulator [Acutalibacter sp. M00118]
MRDPTIDPWLLEFNDIFRENDSLYRSAAQRLGVPACTLWILYSLRVESPPLTQAQLCRLIQQPRQTVNSALKNLEREGAITLSPGGDRRTREVALTPKGAALAAQTADRLIEAEEQALAGLGPQEREGFLRAYRKLNQRLRETMGSM